MVHCETLDNGLRLVVETMPTMRSASVGVWFATGSRDEPHELAGITHFIEHLLFKGTETRSAEEIAVAIDSVGGDLDAATGIETLQCYALVPADHFELAVDLLSDMVLRPQFGEEAVTTELRVVAEEVKQHEDSPAELVHDHFAALLWPGSAVGRGVIGDLERLAELTPDDLRCYWSGIRAGPNAVVSVAGGVRREDAVRLVSERFGALPSDGSPMRQSATAPPQRGGVRCTTRDIEQEHFVIGWPSWPAGDARRRSQTLLDLILGASESSRLWQRIREERGLAYTIWSQTISLRDTGAFAVYAGASPRSVPNVIELVFEEVRAILDGGIGEADVARAKGQCLGGIALALESTSYREARNARAVITSGRPRSYEETRAEIEALTVADIQQAARQILVPSSACIAGIGPAEPAEVECAFRRSARP